QSRTSNPGERLAASYRRTMDSSRAGCTTSRCPDECLSFPTLSRTYVGGHTRGDSSQNHHQKQQGIGHQAKVSLVRFPKCLPPPLFHLALRSTIEIGQRDDSKSSSPKKKSMPPA